MNCTEIFNALNPDFFVSENIRSMPSDWVFTELVMELRDGLPDMPRFKYPSGIGFGEYHGELSELRNAVRKVDADWVRYFNRGDRVFCAFDGDNIAAFCALTDMGRVDGLHIGGPGCVGTLPEYRRQGIGLETVRRATETFRQDGFDLSWIHYTHLAEWYMKLGYKPVLRWNSGGILPAP